MPLCLSKVSPSTLFISTSYTHTATVHSLPVWSNPPPSKKKWMSCHTHNLLVGGSYDNSSIKFSQELTCILVQFDYHQFLSSFIPSYNTYSQLYCLSLLESCTVANLVTCVYHLYYTVDLWKPNVVLFVHQRGPNHFRYTLHLMSSTLSMVRKLILWSRLVELVQGIPRCDTTTGM